MLESGLATFRWHKEHTDSRKETGTSPLTGLVANLRLKGSQTFTCTATASRKLVSSPVASVYKDTSKYQLKLLPSLLS